MRRISRFVTGVVALAALVLAGGLTSGCALIGNESLTQWRPVASGHLSGERPGRLDLGVHELSERTRIEWTASGDPSGRVRLIIRLEGENHGYANSDTIVPGELAGGKVSFTLDEPGEYHVTFSQRFPSKGGPGYDFDVMVSTLR